MTPAAPGAAAVVVKDDKGSVGTLLHCMEETKPEISRTPTENKT